MDIDVVRKDAPVAETIERIHHLLDSLGFRREQALVQRWTAAGDCHSCQLRFGNYPLLFANGKGVTAELAYASALGEFMERLQCWADGFFTQAGNIRRLAPFFPPTGRTPSDLTLDAPELMAGDLREVQEVTAEAIPCVPFVDVFGERVVDLPFGYLCNLTGSNGMCAGNTPEEAISHGICEVFERHVIHLLESRRVLGLPTLPLDSLPVRSEVLARQLSDLKAAGIDVTVKDGTIGGVFPVVAVVLADRKSDTCHVSFGSDAVFEAALSRCLTEAFQGSARLFRRTPPAEGYVRPLDTYNNLESLLDVVRPDVGTPRAAAAFIEAATNRDALRFLLDLTRSSGRRLYVRDFSVFGFPAYYVFVEGLSALRTLPVARVQSRLLDSETVQATVFRLAWASRDEVARCARLLFEVMTSVDPTLEARFLMDVLHAPTAKWIGLRPLVLMMLVEAGELDRALVLADLAPLSAPELTPDRPGATPIEATTSLWQAYRELRGPAIRDDEALASFREACGGPAGAGVANRQLPETDRLLSPRCVSLYACPSCPCRKYCRLDEWCRLAVRMREQATSVDQMQLIRITSALTSA
jgi:YcaO-like protein with predicted kinase domain